MTSLQKFLAEMKAEGRISTATRAANWDKLIAMNEKLVERMESIERRSGSASRQSGYTDALEVSEWARTTLAEVEKMVGE